MIAIVGMAVLELLLAPFVSQRVAGPLLIFLPAHVGLAAAGLAAHAVKNDVTHALAVGVDVGGTFTDLVLRRRGRTRDDVQAAQHAARPERGGGGGARAPRRCAGVALRARHDRRDQHAARAGGRARRARAPPRASPTCSSCARQDRASLYDLSRHHPAPLVPRDRAVGAPERITPDGVQRALDPEGVSRVVERVRALAPDVVAIALLHSYADDRHERLLADALRLGASHVDVVLSSEVFPEIREYERTATTVAEGYLRPGVARYLERLDDARRTARRAGARA